MTILQILLLTLWAGFSQVDQMTFNLLPSGIIPTAIFTGLWLENQNWDYLSEARFNLMP